jgi:hypothetical protein
MKGRPATKPKHDSGILAAFNCRSASLRPAAMREPPADARRVGAPLGNSSHRRAGAYSSLSPLHCSSVSFSASTTEVSLYPSSKDIALST